MSRGPVVLIAHEPNVLILEYIFSCQWRVRVVLIKHWNIPLHNSDLRRSEITNIPEQLHRNQQSRRIPRAQPL